MRGNAGRVLRKVCRDMKKGILEGTPEEVADRIIKAINQDMAAMRKTILGTMETFNEELYGRPAIVPRKPKRRKGEVII